jgi:NADPH:quinone reductase-like Zn-dependent oxidoreductase
MKAVVYDQYGPPEVLSLQEIDKPSPKANEVLIRIHATTVHTGDTRMRKLDIPGGYFEKLFAALFLGFKKPKRTVLGMEIAGEIEAIGEQVTRFKVGDQIFSETGFKALGGYAEYKCLSEKARMAIKPKNMSYEEAAAVPTSGVIALMLVRKVEIAKGQKVLIYGASGAAGTYAVQLAKYFGAEVVAVCSTDKMETMKSIGADQVIDYTKEDFSDLGAVFDIVIDAVSKADQAKCKKSLKKGGKYIDINNTLTIPKQKDLEYLGSIIEEGKVKTVIDRTFPLEQIVEAHRYVDQGHKLGNVIITVG